MKNFKVRAWNIQEQKYLEVAALRFLDGGGIAVGAYKNKSINPVFYSACENIIEFFTGQIDINGGDIYVGDQLESIEGRSRTVNVIWSEKSFTFGVVDINAVSDDLGKDGNQTLDSFLQSCGGKTIGNIH